MNKIELTDTEVKYLIALIIDDTKCIPDDNYAIFARKCIEELVAKLRDKQPEELDNGTR